MPGYSANEVAKLLEVSVGRVRSYVRAGFLDPERGPQGELRFSFQDLILLRTAKELSAARIAPARVRRALKRLKEQLPSGQPLTGVSIAAEGNRIVVRDGRTKWNPESGQGLFDFDVGELARKVAPLVERSAEAAKRAPDEQDADDWYSLGCELELYAPAEARDAYRRAIELEPYHADAHINLGRLLHQAGELGAAEAHYSLALGARPDDATAPFNLGVLLEDLGQLELAVNAYQRALAADPSNADSHYNLARLHERLGRPMEALRHLKAYRRLIQGR
jgi:tetratricopeptide (TPR) repeat protein